MANKKTDYRALSEELDTILEKLQSGDLTIDEALPAYERGMKLLTELETYLKTAETRIEALQADLPS